MKQQFSLTMLMIAICALIYCGYLIDESPDDLSKDEHWGVYSAESLWDGAYWGYLTSNFVHFELIHLVFNVYWLYMLGSVLEKEIGPFRLLLMVIVGCIINSGFQFLVSGDTGNGFSGVIYCFFGFMLMSRPRYSSFYQIITPQTIQIFLVWLVVCVVLTQLNIWYVGNAAHFAGLATGVILGKAVCSKKYTIIGTVSLPSLMAVSVLPLFWHPFSVSWLTHKAEVAYDKGQNQDAVDWLNKAIAMDKDCAWAYYNRGIVYGEMGKISESEADFDTAYKLDATLFEDDQE